MDVDLQGGEALDTHESAFVCPERSPSDGEELDDLDRAYGLWEGL